MSIQTKEYLKTRFETGDKPSQQDFIDLLDSLVGKSEPVESNAWQPPSSPVYMATGQEITCTHPTIVNELYTIAISQEIPGVSGNTNISVDFAQAAEANYIQEDSLYGTDFINGLALLHASPDTNTNVKGLVHFENNLINDGAAGGSAIAYGSAAVSTNRARFGSSSLRIPGSNISGLRFAGSNYSGIIYTLEFNFFFDNLTTSYVGSQIFSIYNSSNPGSNTTYLSIRASDRACRFMVPGLADGSFSAANAFLNSAWNKCVIQTDGSTWVCWINGVKACYYTVSGIKGCNAGSSQCIDFGLGTNATEVLPAMNIDEVRVTVGQNLYDHSANTLINSDMPLGIIYPIAQSYYVMTNDQSHFGFLQASKIQSLVVTNNLPTYTSIRCVASFDGRQTWKKWNGVQWVDSINLKTDNNSIAELQSGFINLTRTTEQFIDLAFILATTDYRVTPSLDQVTIVYTDNSHYEIATAGAYTSTADFGVKRVDPNTTIVKRLNNNPGKVFITMNIG